MEDNISQQPPTYSGSVASKKILWGVGKFIAAKGAAILTSPATLALAAKAAAALTAHGIPVGDVNPTVVQVTASTAIFAGLVAIHDLLKAKTGWKFL